MQTKTKQVGMFLLTGIVLAVAAIYSLPMQQAIACGKSCDGGGGGGKDCCGGSLVSVEDNNIGNNIGNVKTGDILSGNHFKALNNNKIGNFKDVNVLSKNYLKDVNVLSKNYNKLKVSDVVSDNLNDITVKSNDVIEDGSFNDNVQLAFYKLLSSGKSGCGC